MDLGFALPGGSDVSSVSLCHGFVLAEVWGVDFEVSDVADCWLWVSLLGLGFRVQQVIQGWKFGMVHPHTTRKFPVGIYVCILCTGRSKAPNLNP